MSETARKTDLRTVPIYNRRRKHPASGGGTHLAWGLFLVLGIPFALMTALTVLARGGIYVELFKPLWMPWPPDLLKPFLGVGVFAATLGYLAYRLGHREGFRVGTGVGLSAARSYAEAHPVVSVVSAPSEDAANASPPPPPPIEVVPDELGADTGDR